MIFTEWFKNLTLYWYLYIVCTTLNTWNGRMTRYSLNYYVVL